MTTDDEKNDPKTFTMKKRTKLTSLLSRRVKKREKITANNYFVDPVPNIIRVCTGTYSTVSRFEINCATSIFHSLHFRERRRPS